MARKKSTNKYENQALLSMILAGVGGLATLGAIGLLWRNADENFFETYWISYSSNSNYLMILAGTFLCAFAASGIGFLLGLNSAGQKRNTASRMSWMGFFLNAGIITVALCAGIIFAMTRHTISM